MSTRGPVVVATLTYDTGALEALVTAEAQAGGYMPLNVSWSDGSPSECAVTVRPMTPEERTEVHLSNEPLEERIAAAVMDAVARTHAAYQPALEALLEERNEALNWMRQLNAKLDGLLATTQRAAIASSVVQETPGVPKPASMSLTAAAEAAHEGKELTALEKRDREIYVARLAAIREEQAHGNRHPQMPDANRRSRGEHEFDNFEDALAAALDMDR